MINTVFVLSFEKDDYLEILKIFGNLEKGQDYCQKKYKIQLNYWTKASDENTYYFWYSSGSSLISYQLKEWSID